MVWLHLASLRLAPRHSFQPQALSRSYVMKRLSALLVPLLLCACASAPPPKVEVTDVAKSQAATLVDLHPAGENKREAFSYLITSERYGIFRNGDVVTDPPALRLLQHRVFERLGGQGPLTIKVHHFVVYQNLQSTLKAGALGSIFGPLGAAAAASSVKNDLGGSAAVVDPALFADTAGDNEWKRGVMSAEENPTNAAALITWLDVDINGKRVFVRSVSPMKVPEGKVPYVVALEAAFDMLLKQF